MFIYTHPRFACQQIRISVKLLQRVVEVSADDIDICQSPHYTSLQTYILDFFFQFSVQLQILDYKKL